MPRVASAGSSIGARCCDCWRENRNERTGLEAREGAMAALHPLTLDRLERVLQQAGCPVCNEMERTTSRYLRALIREHKSHDRVWERLQRTWGLCRQHTRGMLAEEPRTLPGVSTATLYHWLAETMLEKATGARLTPAELRVLLKPEGMCLACEQLGEYQRALVQSLVRTLESGDPPSAREAYFRRDGLCLPHL